MIRSYLFVLSKTHDHLDWLHSKIDTYQLRRGTVPQVQSYRRESFGILTNPVGGKKLIGKSALRYTTAQNNYF